MSRNVPDEGAVVPVDAIQPEVAAPPAPPPDVEQVRRILVELYEYLLRQVIKLIVAVSICMLSVSVLIRINRQSHNDALQLGYARFADEGADVVGVVAEGVVLMNSFGNAVSFLSMIVIVNVLLVLLYKRGHYNLIQAWMMTGTAILLFLTSYYYMGRIAFYFNLPVDHLTWSLFIWNVGVTGISALYCEGPFLMQQGYLVYISVLMAMILEESFPEWTSWILLVLVSIWDVFAVLCVLGPLRILLETAKERNEQLFPALVFSTSSAWCYNTSERSVILAQAAAPSEAVDGANHFGACAEPAVQETGSRVTSTPQSALEKLASNSPDVLRTRELPATSSRDEGVLSYLWSPSPGDKHHLVENVGKMGAPHAARSERCEEQTFLSISHDNSATSTTSGTNGDKEQSSGASAADSALEDGNRGLLSTRMPNSRNAGGASDSDSQDAHRDPDHGPVAPPTQGCDRGPQNSRDHRSHRHRHSRSARQQEMRDEASSEQGMKMGLGDFIFYSMLVGKASRHGTVVTVISCYVAVIVGILITLFLLVLLQKPLPALPFSITMGIVAYFSSAYLTEPFLDAVDAIVL